MGEAASPEVAGTCSCINMRFLVILALTASQSTAQHGGMGGMGEAASPPSMSSSGSGSMSGSGSGSGSDSGSGSMSGSGSGMAGYGSGMGGYGGGMGGYGGGMGGGDDTWDGCCEVKNVWGSWNPAMDGVYVLV